MKSRVTNSQRDIFLCIPIHAIVGIGSLSVPEVLQMINRRLIFNPIKNTPALSRDKVKPLIPICQGGKINYNFGLLSTLTLNKPRGGGSGEGGPHGGGKKAARRRQQGRDKCGPHGDNGPLINQLGLQQGWRHCGGKLRSYPFDIPSDHYSWGNAEVSCSTSMCKYGEYLSDKFTQK